jgi:hypothetical protein
MIHLRLQTNNNDNNNNGVEIWLDLRGTSLSPSTALELWELEHANINDDESNKSTTVPFTKCLVSNHDINNNNSYLNSNLQVLIDHNESSSSTSSWGKTLPLQINPNTQQPILPDPLPAMELISQQQGYIVLDTTKEWKKVEEELRLSYLLPLAELISSGALSPSSSSGAGEGGNSAGGIGFTCLTKNEVVKVAMWIQSITNRHPQWNNDGSGQKNVRVKTLDNGLVIPDYDNDVTDDDLETTTFGSTTSRQQLQYAIVVPYDVGLIKTASMLLLNEGFSQ